MVTVAKPPAGITPRLPVTRPPFWEQLPCDELVETKEALGGRKLVIVTPVAAAGPVLLTVNVYAQFAPAETGLGEAVILMDKSLVRSASNGLLRLTWPS